VGPTGFMLAISFAEFVMDSIKVHEAMT